MNVILRFDGRVNGHLVHALGRRTVEHYFGSSSDGNQPSEMMCYEWIRLNGLSPGGRRKREPYIKYILEEWRNTESKPNQKSCLSPVMTCSAGNRWSGVGKQAGAIQSLNSILII